MIYLVLNQFKTLKCFMMLHIVYFLFLFFDTYRELIVFFFQLLCLIKCRMFLRNKSAYFKLLL